MEPPIIRKIRKLLKQDKTAACLEILNASEKGTIYGIYEHFKGNKYELLHIGLGTEDDIVYAVYKGKEQGEIWIRPAIQFFDEHPKEKVKRFKKV